MGDDPVIDQSGVRVLRGSEGNEGTVLRVADIDINSVLYLSLRVLNEWIDSISSKFIKSACSPRAEYMQSERVNVDEEIEKDLRKFRSSKASRTSSHK